MQTTKPRTVREITDLFSATLRDAVGATVEVVSRACGTWTFVGQPDDVQAAVAYVQAHGLMRLEKPVEYDEELGESFAFLADGAAS